MRQDSPAAFQLLHGSGAPRAGSGLEPLNGVNDPWRWWTAGAQWITQPHDVSWSAGATIASFAAPTAGELTVVIGTRGENPADLFTSQAATAGTVVDYLSNPGERRPSNPVTIAGSGTGVAFLVWDFFSESQLAGSTYVYDNTDVLPAESRTVADLLGADFTVSAPDEWSEEAVGHLGDFYIDTGSATRDLYGPRLQNTWGADPIARLSGLVSPDGTAYRLKVADNGTLSTEAI